MAGFQRIHKALRKSFGRVSSALDMPNLIEVQRSSYEQFLQHGIEDRKDIGLQAVFRSVFPVQDYLGRAELEFIRYELEEPKYDVDECQQRGVTYASALRVTLSLTIYDVDEDTSVRTFRESREQDVYVGDIPLMTENGTFIINGTERVVVSQMHRSPGVVFDHDRGKSHASGKFLYNARIIPYWGAWIDFEFDHKDLLYVRIDRRRKLPVTTLLQSLRDEKAEDNVGSDKAGLMDRAGILKHFYSFIKVTKVKSGDYHAAFEAKQWKGVRPTKDLIDGASGEVLAKAGERISNTKIEKWKNIKTYQIDLTGHYLGHDIIDGKTGEVLALAGTEITDDVLKVMAEIESFDIVAADDASVGPYLLQTLAIDKNTVRSQALIDIYRVIRPGEPATIEAAERLFHSLFFDSERYDLSAVGRVKMNAHLGLETDDQVRTLRNVDLLVIIKMLCELKEGQGDIDDIDNLGNRRVRSVGELIENQFRVGLMRMDRTIRERMSSADFDKITPHDLVNARPAVTAVREFFGSSQLSQFMDQTNPLSEVTHKRRLSALGPGGLTRERAGFEVRDVHTTHYGRICPIETPEGPNIGLINSLASYARINRYGFIESPYRKVQKGKIKDEFVYLSADMEKDHTIGQATDGWSQEDAFVSARQNGEYTQVSKDQVDLVDVSPMQTVSVAASLIPFLENDDANRALMGSNMQRQALPLLTPEAPMVGTGMEETVARDSGAVIIARRKGVVDQVDASRVVVRITEEVAADESAVDVYRLRKFHRSNQNTCINQRVLVQQGQAVERGDILADGPSTDRGELALGRNVLCAFMPWHGYNFEDSILISERVVRDDVFTSIHIEEFDVLPRDTKLGPEEITRDVPNVSEESLRHLDEAGIVYVGAEVGPGDILVGKVTPKGETPITPEEKLLRAIFGEKASHVRDTSLLVPPGVRGTVVDVAIFSRRGVEKDERSIAIERLEIERLAKDRDDEIVILNRSVGKRLREFLIGEKVVSAPGSIKKGTNIDAAMLDELPMKKWREISITNEKKMGDIEVIFKSADAARKDIHARFTSKVDKLQHGDELPQGVLKMIKVFVAVKRKVQPGDKMAGRHGNKGVISRIMPIADMPFLEDGTPVDVVLNPLGVPSRMNVGQILETHMGWACVGMGKKIQRLLDTMTQAAKRDANASKAALKDLRSNVQTIYKNTLHNKDVAAMDDHSMVNLADSLVRGVPIATPVFDGAREADIVQMMELAGVNSVGQEQLIDGQTGEPFDRPVTVGYIYMMKLHHLVDDKIHARSTGPYSLVTQQPLGGKALFGGQRFGEMEVWALQAYGAAYTLQEILTVKSDDVAGRTQAYESVIRGDNDFEIGLPESFNVLVKELKALGLDVELS
ncbi:MAG: DNA-directed RNA polymerase subunit beta [Pseudomonadota bacterium]